MDRFYAAIDCITIVLSREKTMLDLLTSYEIKALPEIIDLLKPLADITNMLNGNSKITISLIIPCTTSFLKELNEKSAKMTTEIRKKLADNLIHYTKKRLSSYELNSLTRYDFQKKIILLVLIFTNTSLCIIFV